MSAGLDEILKRFPGRLKRLRVSARLSQADLGNRCGLGQGDISRYETGSYLPTLANAVRLAVAMRISLDVLLGKPRAL